ncbi:MAG: RNA polymerase sigma-70 factor, ECF subfamily [Parcubacteria group bacterium Gr01-1014_31]|nr:MAG: RNA polymerase sigma-70 factor, ECF subfamily [Parcubacteria group bacterium Gr01-1014_31]
MNKIQQHHLAHRIASGDSAAFSELYNEYIARIYRFILFKVRTHEEAEDLSADVFLRAWQYLYQQQRSVQSIGALLYQIARNLVIDHYRQRASQDVSLDTDVLLDAVDHHQQRLFQQIERSVELVDIANAVRQLKDEYKDVVLLRYVEELSIGEIADIVGKSKGAVRVILFRALQIIRTQFNDPATTTPSTHEPS